MKITWQPPSFPGIPSVMEASSKCYPASVPDTNRQQVQKTQYFSCETLSTEFPNMLVSLPMYLGKRPLHVPDVRALLFATPLPPHRRQKDKNKGGEEAGRGQARQDRFMDRLVR